MTKNSQQKDINIKVTLDENNIPAGIEWDATDMSEQDVAQCRAMMLAMWDHQKQDTLRLDLWTKEMTIEEMKIFFHQTLVTMAETLENSTKEEQMAEDLRDFTAYFAEKMEIME